MNPQPPTENKQRVQIQNMLSDFEKTAKFNRDQLKNFGSPKAPGPPPTQTHQQQQQFQQIAMAAKKGSSKGKKNTTAVPTNKLRLE
jgi:hypothetical protein